MAGRAPGKIELSAAQRRILGSIVRRETSPQRLVRRAKLILACAEETYNQAAGGRVGVSRGVARQWRARWLGEQKRLEEVESAGDERELGRSIEEILSDAPGRGGKPKFTSEQVCQIVAVACEPPEASDRPTTHWSQQELAKEVIKRGIVQSISARQVGRFFKRGSHQASLDALLAQSNHRRPRGIRHERHPGF